MGVPSQQGQATQARLCLSIEHAHSMRSKEALTVVMDRFGVGLGRTFVMGTEEHKQAN